MEERWAGVGFYYYSYLSQMCSLSPIGRTKKKTSEPRSVYSGGSFNTVKVGSFNVQIFGQTKSGKPDVMDVLAKVIRRYDIILIQEIRDSAGTAINRLLEDVNSDGSQFKMILSDRLGRGNSKEQYAYFYRSESSVSVKDSYHYDDGDEAAGTDTFEREPFVVQFLVPQTVLKQLSIIGIHVRPDRAPEEIEALRDVYNDAKSRWSDDNVLIMGDLNADCSYVNKGQMESLTMRHDFYWPVDDDVDTTVSNSDCAYDRFIVGGEKLTHAIINGSAVPYRFDNVYSLTPELAGEVSDHYPIELEIMEDSGASGTVKQTFFSVTCALLCALRI